MDKKLHILLIFSNFVVEIKSESQENHMYNFCAKFRQILDICKRHSENLVNSLGNVPRVGVVPRFSDLEVIALSLASEALGIDSENCLFHRLSRCKNEIPNLISRRQYNDRRKLTAGLCEEIRKRIADEIDGGEDCFIVDSKPIEVCRPARSKCCAMGRGDINRAPAYGYCASQRRHYYGYKLHGLTGMSGVFHSYDITAANVHDINYLNDIKLEYHDCGIVGDKGYLSAEVQLDLFETANIRLNTPARSNQKNAKPFPTIFRKVRKRIETNFSQLCDQFLFIRNYAKNVDGLFMRIIGKISAFTVFQYINKTNNKPIGQIKYALV